MIDLDTCSRGKSQEKTIILTDKGHKDDERTRTKIQADAVEFGIHETDDLYDQLLVIVLRMSQSIRKQSIQDGRRSVR